MSVGRIVAQMERVCDDVSSNANILIIAMKRSWINECEGKFVPHFRARKITNLKENMRGSHFAHHELMKHLHFQFPFWRTFTECVELFRSRSARHAIQNRNKFRLLLLPNNLLLFFSVTSGSAMSSYLFSANVEKCTQRANSRDTRTSRTTCNVC